MIDQLKAVFVAALAKQAYAALIAIPGFGWVFALPVVRQVVQFIIERVIRWGVQETSIGLSLLWIQVEMSYEIDSAETARKKLELMLNHPEKYTELQQREISEHFDETTIDLIQLGLKRLS